jgi:hypothetical protein
MDPSTPLDPDPIDLEDSSRRANRIWQHGLHLDTMLFQRGNIFLIAESLLIVAYTSILGVARASGHDTLSIGPLLAARIIASFGLLFTLIWAYVAHRHLLYCNYIIVRMKAHIPEYRDTREGWSIQGPSSLSLVTYCLPALSFVMWTLLLIVTWL